MDNIVIRFAKIVEKIHDEMNVGIYASMADNTGSMIACIKMGEVARASFEISQKKTMTAFEFKNYTDVIYNVLSKIGTQPLIDGKYCFLPGGVVLHDNLQREFFIGISTNNPDIDKEIAKKLSTVL
ncbi:MAG: hypothetical protein XXXJIFNMEKO3_03064 [Candidatus Erwinia impunctatus]|nr:hypothetical protein XXXJIFNMEKO_03064 [Culicoides impunctatus]